MSDITEFLLNRIDKLDDKIDTAHHKMMAQLSEQSRLLADYNDSLREHMRRTEILEEKLEPVYIDHRDKVITSKVVTAKWKKIMWIVGSIGTIVGLLTGIAGLVGML